MNNENTFRTKIIPSNIDFFGWAKNYKENCDIEGVGYVEWEFYVEYRSWGVKNISVYATNVDIDYTVDRWMEDEDDIVEEYSIDTTLPLFDKWEIETNTYELEFGLCIEPQNVAVDFDTKTITITF